MNVIERSNFAKLNSLRDSLLLSPVTSSSLELEEDVEGAELDLRKKGTGQGTRYNKKIIIPGSDIAEHRAQFRFYVTEICMAVQARIQTLEGITKLREKRRCQRHSFFAFSQARLKGGNLLRAKTTTMRNSERLNDTHEMRESLSHCVRLFAR
jgi:hypothetical protein